MSGKASVRLRLRRSDSLALRQMPPLPLPVLPQLPLESSSAVAADAETHGNVGDGRSPAGRRPPAGDIEEEVGACSSLEDFSIFFFLCHARRRRTPLLLRHTSARPCAVPCLPQCHH